MSIFEIIPVEPLSRIATGCVRPVVAISPPAFPDIEPAQLWLVELPTAKSPLSERLRRVLARANVIIYDRSLASATAALLPTGGYAEPAAPAEGGGDPAAERCVRFARDGWSVIRLVPARLPRRQRAERVHRFAAALDAAKASASLPVKLWIETPDAAAELIETRLSDLPEAVLAQPRDARLTIAIAALDNGAAAGFHAIAANGLAG